MKTVLKILAVLLVLCLLAGGGIYYYIFQAGDKTPLEQLVPADALAYADVKEIRKIALEIAASDQAGPYSEMAKVFGGLIALAKEQIAADADADSSEFPSPDWTPLLNAAAQFNRQISLFALESENEAFPVNAYLMAHLQGDPSDFNQSIDSFLDSVNQEMSRIDADAPTNSVETKNIGGNEIRFVNLPKPKNDEAFPIEFQPSWAIIDEKCVMALNPDSLADFLSSLSSRTPETSLANETGFQLAAQHQSTIDAQVYMNLEKLVEALALFANETFGVNAQQVGVSVDNVIDELGFRELKTGFYAIDFDPSSSLITSGLAFGERKGILAMYSKFPDTELPKFFPESAYSASSLSMDIGEAILLLKDIVLKAAPMAAIMYPKQKEMIDQQLGMDVEVFARETFTAEFHTMNELSAGEPNEDGIPNVNQSQTMVSGLANAASFQAMLTEKLAPMREAGMLNLLEEDVAGFTLYKIAGATPAAPSSFGYAIARDKLFIGFGTGSDPLHSLNESLTLLASDGPGAFQSPEVSKFLGNSDDNRISNASVDIGLLAKVASAFGRQARDAAEEEGDTDTVNLLNRIDWDALERIKFKMVSRSTEEEHLYLSTSRTITE